MSGIFGGTYAGVYDLLYHDKNYDAECTLIEQIFETYGNGAVRTVLDLGCGTGNHLLPLAQRGYEVVGADQSESMLEQARRKAAERLRDGSGIFRRDDIFCVDLGRDFDVVLLMFAVWGYQLENGDGLCTLRTARKHLRPGGFCSLTSGTVPRSSVSVPRSVSRSFLSRMGRY